MIDRINTPTDKFKVHFQDKNRKIDFIKVGFRALGTLMFVIKTQCRIKL